MLSIAIVAFASAVVGGIVGFALSLAALMWVTTDPTPSVSVPRTPSNG